MTVFWLSFLVFFFLIISAFFSGNETGLLSCSYLKVISESKKEDSSSKILLYLLHRKNQAILICLMGINMANTVYSLAFDFLFQQMGVLQNFSTLWSHFIQISVITIILVIFAEIFPKTLFYEYSFRLTRRSTRILILCKKVMQPFIHLVFNKSKPQEMQKPNLEVDTIRLMTSAQETDFKYIYQKNMVNYVLSLKDREVSSFVYFTNLMIQVTMEDTIQDALDKTTDTNLPIFVWKDSCIIGLLELKDIDKFSFKSKIKDLKTTVLKTVRATDKGLFVLKLFLNLQNKNQVFLVEDQGKMIGYVTLQRLLDPVFFM